jgi:hypothetical protein
LQDSAVEKPDRLPASLKTAADFPGLLFFGLIRDDVTPLTAWK